VEVPYPAESDLQTIVEQFERCDLSLEEFTHARHLTVAAIYLTKFSFDEALARMRVGLQRFITHHAKQGYHETITRFWMELLFSFLNGIAPETSVTERINEVVARYGSKEILFEYYTKGQVMSETARHAWVEPDLKSLPQN
jgi:hypothetical protein